MYHANRLTLEDWTDKLSRNVGSCQSKLRNIPEGLRPQETIIVKFEAF